MERINQSLPQQEFTSLPEKNSHLSDLNDLPQTLKSVVHSLASGVESIAENAVRGHDGTPEGIKRAKELSSARQATFVGFAGTVFTIGAAGAGMATAVGKDETAAMFMIGAIGVTTVVASAVALANAGVAVAAKGVQASAKAVADYTKP